MPERIFIVLSVYSKRTQDVQVQIIQLCKKKNCDIIAAVLR